MDKDKIKNNKEKVTASMIRIYCRGVHGGKQHLCDDCESLRVYSLKRLEKCPHANTNTFCSECSIKCYEKQKQEEMRVVMRYAGPRMIIYHPIIAIRHVMSKKNNLLKKEIV